ncbi:hypothetical protein [Viridibacillus arvi]|uniref:hypothetical protein n=1 Tax=Viridibacillus arvi TaxID=263475 RepID=UPI003CFFD3A2
MVFIKISKGNNIDYIHYMPFDDTHGLHKSEEDLLQEGILVDFIQEPERIEGKSPVLKYNSTELYYDYEDVPIDEMTALKNKIELQEQVLAELTMYISTLTI